MFSTFLNGILYFLSTEFNYIFAYFLSKFSMQILFSFIIFCSLQVDCIIVSFLEYSALFNLELFHNYSRDNYQRKLFCMNLSQNLHKIVHWRTEAWAIKTILCKFRTKTAQMQLVRKHFRGNKIINVN